MLFLVGGDVELLEAAAAEADVESDVSFFELPPLFLAEDREAGMVRFYWGTSAVVWRLAW